MTVASPYSRIFADPRHFSFHRLPLILPAPRQGRTWTIRWLRQSGQLVRAEEPLLRLESDAGGERQIFRSPAPGRLLERAPDGRFVAHHRPVGKLEYALGFRPPHARSDAEAQLRREIAARRQAQRHKAQQREAMERSIHEAERCLASLRQEINAMESQLAALATGEKALSAVPQLLQAYTDTLIARLRASGVPQDAGSFPVLWQSQLLLEWLDELDQAERGSPAGPNACGVRSPALLARLFRWLIPRAAGSVPGLPPSIRRHQRECWEEVEEAFQRRSDPPAPDP